MDPDICLQNILEIRKELSNILEGKEECSQEVFRDMVSELCFYISSLHEWLKSGGFTPKAWGVRNQAWQGGEVVK